MWLDENSGLDGQINIRGQISGVPTGTTIEMDILTSSATLVDGTFTETTDADGYFQANTGISSAGVSSITVKFTESVHSCSTTRTDTLDTKPD